VTSSPMPPPAPLVPFETLFDSASGGEIPLPPALAALYGPLRLPTPAGRPYALGNFVTTLDGVVALDDPATGGGAISGYNRNDRALMGLLRAVSDAVVVAAGTLRADARHLWTPAGIYPDLADAYAALRAALGKPPQPLDVFVTASGDLDLTLPVFASGRVPVLIVTSADGAARLVAQQPPEWVRVTAAAPGREPVTVRGVLDAVIAAGARERILIEGGPRFMGEVFAAALLDELFLTLAPQVAGRDAAHPRPALVEGQLFAPAAPLWPTLTSLKRAHSHIFTRYAFTEAG
jgi:riboflavin biosynthesis pyrimidine reductase